MSGIVSSIATTALGAASGYLGAEAQKDAAKTAAGAQTQAAQMGIDEQRRQFDLVRQLLEPYVQAGRGSLAGQQALLGLSGNPAQSAAFNQITNSPMYTGLLQQGENAILQNASATGGLRGGNTQAALAQFRPQLLNQLITQQLNSLSGLTQIGQNSAAGVGNQASNMANNVGGLYGNIGQIQAGNAQAQGDAQTGLYDTLGRAAGGFLDSYKQYTSTPEYRLAQMGNPQQSPWLSAWAGTPQQSTIPGIGVRGF